MSDKRGLADKMSDRAWWEELPLEGPSQADIKVVPESIRKRREARTGTQKNDKRVPEIA